MKAVAAVVAVGLAGAFVWRTINNAPPQTEEAANIPQDAAPRAGITFTPRYPDATNSPEAPTPEPTPWRKKRFPLPKLTRPMTNDGLRHDGGVLYIGPMRFLPPGPRDYGVKYRVEIPPGYKMIETNVDAFNRDVLIVPRPAPTLTTPEDIIAAINQFTSEPDDDTWLQRRDSLIDAIGVDEYRRREHERIGVLNQQNNEHFRKEMRAELEKRGSTPQEIDEWFARYERERKVRDRLGIDNYTKARRSVERAYRQQEPAP